MHAVDRLREEVEGLLRAHPEVRRPLTVDVAVAASAYTGADLPEMAAALDRVAAAGPVPDPETAGMVALFEGLYLAAQERYPEALERLTSPALAALRPSLLTLFRDIELALVDIAQGEAERAVDRLRAYDDGPLSTTADLVLAQAYTALGDLARARTLGRRVRTGANPQTSRSLLVRAMILEAQIALAAGDEAGSLDQLQRALDLADGSVVMPFLQAHRQLEGMLARHEAMAARWPRAVPAPPEPPRASPPTSLAAHLLTERERAVLRLLTTTMSTAEMAAELFLSTNTVKTHLTAVYRKIGVTRRRDAVARARELELL